MELEERAVLRVSTLSHTNRERGRVALACLLAAAGLAVTGAVGGAAVASPVTGPAPAVSTAVHAATGARTGTLTDWSGGVIPQGISWS